MTVTPQTVLKFLAGATLVAAILFLVWYFSAIVVYILVSAVLAVVGRPLTRRLGELRIRGRQVPRWAAALCTLAVIWAVLSVLCSLFIPLVFNKVYQLAALDFGTVVESVQEPLARAQHYLYVFFGVPETTFSLPDAVIDAFKSLINIDSINTAFSSIVNVVVSSAIAVFSISFITFFFLKDDGLFSAMVTAVFPERYHDNVRRALDSVTLLLSLTMMAFGMKMADATFIGLIMGVMNVVPYAGPLIGGSLSVCLGVVTPIPGFTAGHTMLVIACSLLVLKGLDDFVIQPSLYSNRVRAHPLEIFIVILIAGTLGGIVGMLLAIPSYTVLRVFAKEFFSQYRLVRQLTEKI